MDHDDQLFDYVDSFEAIFEASSSDMSTLSQKSNSQFSDKIYENISSYISKIPPFEKNNDQSYDFGDKFDNLKINKVIRDTFDLTTVYEIEDKNTKEKYFSEFRDIFLDYDYLYYGDFFQKYYEKFNHGAILNYVGISKYDFNFKRRPVLLSEFCPNGTLNDFLKPEKYGYTIPLFTNTHRMIILYGIASGMKYFHSNSLLSLYPNLISTNIVLDDYLFPKISFYLFPKIERNKMDSRVYGEQFFDSTDGWENQIFLFALIVYELLMKKKAFHSASLSHFRMLYNDENYRPKIDEKVPTCYKNLIEKCWSPEISKRPSFDEIAEMLKSQEFILPDVDKEVYFEYIRVIESYEEISNKFKKKIPFEYFLTLQTDKFKKFVRFEDNFNYGSEEDTNEISQLNIEQCDLSNYEKKKKIGEGIFGNVFKVENKETKEILAAKISKRQIHKQDENYVNVFREILIISKLNHPNILRFIGYSPKDFENKDKPAILTEFNSNGSLKRLFDLIRKGAKIKEWNDVKKLICIYGIASCMSYLHSKDIVHRDLKPDNILLDDYLNPKLANFCYATVPNEKEQNVLIGMPKYFAPEIFEKEEYSKASDVYAFSLIIYEIITEDKPFSGCTIYQMMNGVLGGERPFLNKRIPKVYRNLIESCWSQEPSKRLTFDQIIQELRTNKEFLFDDEDRSEFLNYVKYIDEYKLQLERQNQVLQYEDYFRNLNKPIKKVDLVPIRKKYFKDVVINVPSIKLVDFNLKDKIGQGSFSKVYRVQEKSTNEIYAAKLYKKPLEEFNDDDLKNHVREVNIISRLKHPCILKFVGYSPMNFKNKKRPVIITEYVPKCSLQDAIDRERHGIAYPEWNTTTKLKVIYGIAAALQYMHNHNIIHRDLKPENILLDENFNPKIADFGLSKELPKNDINIADSDSEYEIKGTLLYCSPEILASKTYTKAGDVYAFGMIVYEIITNEKPFNNIKYLPHLIIQVIKGVRPLFTYTTHIIYYERLIEDCWKQNPSERPSFDSIIKELKEKVSYISADVDVEDYSDYISNIDKYLLEHKDEFEINIKKAEILSTNDKNSSNLIKSHDDKNEEMDAKINKNEENDKNKIKKENELNIKTFDFNKEPNRTEPTPPQSHEMNACDSKSSDEMITQKYIQLYKPKDLIQYLVSNFDNDKISVVFDRCYNEAHDFFIDLCKEGILINNAVAHHKYAMSLIFDGKDRNKAVRISRFKESKSHLEESIRLGFTNSYFLLSRLMHEVFHDDKAAVQLASEGMNRGDSCSKCLLGYFISRGISTEKDLQKGVRMMLDSCEENFYEQFATEIGLYYAEMAKIDPENERNAYKWFEKAYEMRKTEATINNYGLCFFLGFGVSKSIQKAQEIFEKGASNGDTNSKYHLYFIYKETNPEKSFDYIKEAAYEGHSLAQQKCSQILFKNDQEESLKNSKLLSKQ